MNNGFGEASEEARIAAAAEAAEKKAKQTGEAVVINEKPDEIVAQTSEKATYGSYDDVHKKFLEVFPAGKALIAELQPKLKSHEQIEDTDIERVTDALKTVNVLLGTRFSDQGSADTYPQLLELKRDLVQVKVDNLLNSLPEGLLNGSVKLADAGEGVEGQLQYVASQLAAMGSEDPATQAKLAETILAKLKNETPQLDPSLDSYDDAEKKKDASGERDEVETELDNAEQNEKDPQKKKLILQAKVVWKALGIAGMVAGVTLKTFFDAKKGDLGAFISFIMNPTGRSSSGYEFGSAKNENGEVPHHLFKQKFEDYRLVGKALHKCAPNLTPPRWASDVDIQKKLRHVGETTDVVTTFDLLMSFNDMALKPNSVNSSDNWDVFSKEFASALFGEDDLDMDDESIKFLKEKFVDDGAQLREFWRMSGSGNETSAADSTSAPEPQAVPDQPLQTNDAGETGDSAS